MRQYQRRIGREGTQHLGGGTVTKVVETAAQGLAIQRDAALPGGCARRLKQRRMATKTGLYRSRIEPLEDIADGRVSGRSTPCKTERFVQPATMKVTMPRDELQPVTMARIENSNTWGRL